MQITEKIKKNNAKAVAVYDGNILKAVTFLSSTQWHKPIHENSAIIAMADVGRVGDTL